MTTVGLAVALALGATLPPPPAGPDLRTSLPPAPVQLYRTVWQRPLVPVKPLEVGPQERGGAAVDPQRGLVIVGTRDAWLHAFRPDGTVAWELKGAGGGFGTPTIDGDTVYVGSSDGNLYAVAIPTGKARWIYPAKEDVSTRPALAGGLVLVASLQDTIFAVDARTGAWKWHHRREQKADSLTIFGAAAVAVGGGAAFAAYSDGFVASLDPATGASRWERRVAPTGTHLDVDSIALDGDRLYAAAYSGAVLALDARTGKDLWSFAAPAASRVAVGAGFVFAVTPTSVFVLAPTSGGVLWTAPLEGSPGAAPVLAGKWLLVPSGAGGLRWLEAATGRSLRHFDPGTGVLAAPGVGGGRVYVLSNGGDLLALDLAG